MMTSMNLPTNSKGKPKLPRRKILDVVVVGGAVRLECGHVVFMPYKRRGYYDLKSTGCERCYDALYYAEVERIKALKVEAAK